MRLFLITLFALFPITASAEAPAPLGLEIGGGCNEQIDEAHVSRKRLDRAEGTTSYSLAPTAVGLDGGMLILAQCGPRNRLQQLELYLSQSRGSATFRAMAQEIADAYPVKAVHRSPSKRSVYQADGVEIEVLEPGTGRLNAIAYTMDAATVRTARW